MRPRTGSTDRAINLLTAGPPPAGVYGLLAGGRRQSVEEMSLMSQIMIWSKGTMVPLTRT